MSHYCLPKTLSNFIPLPPPFSRSSWFSSLLLTFLLSHSSYRTLSSDLSSVGPKSRPTLSNCSNTDTPVSELSQTLTADFGPHWAFSETPDPHVHPPTDKQTNTNTDTAPPFIVSPTGLWPPTNHQPWRILRLIGGFTCWNLQKPYPIPLQT